MDNNLSLLKNQYKDYNLLVPGATDVQLNPFYKATIMAVQADLSDNSGDIFKVGTVKVGDNWLDTYSPAKPLLMKLAAAAGIQFDPHNTYGTMLSKNCYKAKAFGAIRLPDGSGKTHCDEKIINLEDEEDRFRLEFMDKSIKGIKEWKAANAAAELFAGEWVETGEKNDKGYPVKVYKINDSDRQKYIDRSVMVNMTLLRKTAAEKAMTGAILRVVRALIGMKGQYTKTELQRPFAVCRVTFSPDYNDPEVRRAVIGQGINSVGNMFGSSASGLLENDAHEGGFSTHDDFDPSAFAENPAFASDQSSTEPDIDEPPATTPPSAQPQTKPGKTDAAPNCCTNCGEVITPRVAEFSVKTFGRPLCMGCQKGAERA